MPRSTKHSSLGRRRSPSSHSGYSNSPDGKTVPGAAAGVRRGARIRPAGASRWEHARPAATARRAARRRRRPRRRASKGRRILEGRHRRRDAPAGVHVCVRPECGCPDRPTLDGGREVAQPHRAVPHPGRARRRRHRRCPRAARRARRAHSRQAAHDHGRTGDRDTGPVRADRRRGQGRAEQARGELQHDARCAGGIDPRAASARGGRVARAANASHERSHEHRGARGRPNAATRGSPPPALGRRRAARRDDDVDLGAHRARTSRAAHK